MLVDKSKKKTAPAFFNPAAHSQGPGGRHSQTHALSAGALWDQYELEHISTRESGTFTDAGCLLTARGHVSGSDSGEKVVIFHSILMM